MGLINEISIKRIHIEEKIRGHFFIYLPMELTRPISSSLREVSTWRFREQIAHSKKTPALQANGVNDLSDLVVLIII